MINFDKNQRANSEDPRYLPEFFNVRNFSVKIAKENHTNPSNAGYSEQYPVKYTPKIF
jgi:hypothetical protein